ncbi:MAG: hypothetical protein HY263_05960 [Chloroflexi bacterium]|nr:hypothetical protein [Chloroflexota bacterium]
MARVISIVRGDIPAERIAGLVAAYGEAIEHGRPPAIVETFLASGSGTVAIVTVWRERADLEAMVASGEEPLARRLIREAGGAPQVEFLDVLLGAGPG